MAEDASGMATPDTPNFNGISTPRKEGIFDITEANFQ